MLSSLYKPALRLFPLLSKEQKKGGIICLFIMITLALSEIVAAALIVKMASVITSPTPDTKELFFLAITCLITFVIKGLIALADSYFQNRWIQKLILNFKERLIRRYTKMSYAQQITTNSSDSLSVLYNDADVYMRIGLTSTGILLSETTVFAVLMCFLIYLQPTVTGVLVVIFSVLGIVFIKKLVPVFKKWGRIVQETVQAGYKAAITVLQSYKDILIFGKSDFFIQKYMDQSVKRADVAVKAAVSQVIPRVILEVVFILFFVGLVITFIKTNQDIASLTTVLSAYLYAGFRLLPSLNRMMIQINNVKMSEASINRIIEEITSPLKEAYYLYEPDLEFKDTISLHNLSFKYPGKEKNVLNGINLNINKGEFVGVIGETGSGKSTLLHIILGLLEPDSGEARIDKKYKTNSYEWHRKIGYAAQDFQLIDGTIEENIAYGIPEEERDPKRISQVIKSAKLDNFITNLPKREKTYIGEKGTLISGGERQRIALARALYQQPEVLVLDEATSALDLDTEKSIMEAIEELNDDNLTIIAVTHRLDTLRHADRIIKIDKGRIKDE